MSTYLSPGPRTVLPKQASFFHLRFLGYSLQATGLNSTDARTITDYVASANEMPLGSVDVVLFKLLYNEEALPSS